MEGPLAGYATKYCREGRERHDTPLSAGVYHPDHAETLISLRENRRICHPLGVPKLPRRYALSLCCFFCLPSQWRQPQASRGSDFSSLMASAITIGIRQRHWCAASWKLRGCSQFRFRRLHPPPRLRDGNSGVRTLATRTESFKPATTSAAALPRRLRSRLLLQTNSGSAAAVLV